MMASQNPDSVFAWPWSAHYFSDSSGDGLGDRVEDGKGTNYWLCWIGLVIVYITYYLTMVVAKPKVICSGKALKEIIVEHCPIFYECYWPVVWAFNSHIMTVIRARIQYSPNVKYKRDVLPLKDGGQLALDWMDPEDGSLSEDASPVMIVMPGLTGHSDDNYIRYLVKDGHSQGYRPVVFNQRGNGGLELLTPRGYCASNTEDLCEVVDHVTKKYPGVPVVGVGVSLGAMLLTKYLAETGEESKLSGVVAVSGIWDSITSSSGLEQFPSRQIYNWYLARSLRQIVKRNVPKILEKYSLSSLPYDVEEILKGSLISDFDRSFTIKVFGYPTLTDYYRDSSNKYRLHLVKKPLICLQAEDDPFAPQKTLPYAKFEENENTVLVTTPCGGHFGFMEGIRPFGMSWMDRAVQQCLAALKRVPAS